MGSKTWTPEQEKYLRDNYAAMTNESLAVALGKTAKAIKSRATLLNVTRRNAEKYRVLTESEKDLIRQKYPKGDLEALRIELGLGKLTILYQKAINLGVFRDAELLKEQNQKLGRALAAKDNGHRFTKGFTPINKGKKQAEFMSAEAIERTKATRFKSGEKTHNRKPLGSERYGKDGYVEVKVRDMAGSDNYEFKHRIVWEQNYGPIPDGCIVEFIDGDKYNFLPDNLRCVTRRENIKRNTDNYRALPGDIKEVIKLNNQLKSVLK